MDGFHPGYVKRNMYILDIDSFPLSLRTVYRSYLRDGVDMRLFMQTALSCVQLEGPLDTDANTVMERVRRAFLFSQHGPGTPTFSRSVCQALDHLQPLGRLIQLRLYHDLQSIDPTTQVAVVKPHLAVLTLQPPFE